jgi:hypothetical protein
LEQAVDLVEAEIDTGLRIPPERSNGNRFRFSRLHEGTVTFRVRVSGEWHELQHRGSDPIARLKL